MIAEIAIPLTLSHAKIAGDTTAKSALSWLSVAFAKNIFVQVALEVFHVLPLIVR